MALFFVGCLNLFGASFALPRLKGLMYLLMGLVTYASHAGAGTPQAGLSLILLTAMTSLFIFVSMRLYLAEPQSAALEDFDDFDD